MKLSFDFSDEKYDRADRIVSVYEGRYKRLAQRRKDALFALSFADLNPREHQVERSAFRRCVRLLERVEQLQADKLAVVHQEGDLFAAVLWQSLRSRYPVERVIYRLRNCDELSSSRYIVAYTVQQALKKAIAYRKRNHL